MLTMLWLSSYTHHTGVGVDHDFEYEGKILRTYSRISWTGHGSIWVGYGSTWKESHPGLRPEQFDLAAVFFQRVNQQTDKLLNAPSFWNEAGFWFIRGTVTKPTLWIGVPSWLPVLVLGGLLFSLRRTGSY